MSRYTKIICTLGPASDDEIILKKMAERGMDVSRINFSHGIHKQHQKSIDLVRLVNQRHHFNVKILQDLEGYRIRIGDLKKRIMLNEGAIVYMSHEAGDEPNHIPFDFSGDIKTIKKGDYVFIDDGMLHLRVIGHVGKKLKLKVVQGGLLKEHKGVNIPNLKLDANIMTAQDADDIEFGIQNHVDFIAQSFVRNKKDIQRVVDTVRPRLPECKIVAKIENSEGLDHLEGIIDSCDGVMVARGDLGVTMPIHKIPLIQKYIIRLCNRKKKFSIIATQMLESMIEKGRPTRAEVSDVANAILDGGDYVMLSAETAVGRYPSRTIKMMSQIIENTERYQNLKVF